MLYNKSIDKFFSEESMLDFSTMIYRIPALLFAITIHEYAHAQCADSMGDPTARYMGRMTFNPMAHLDPLGAILLVVAGFGWAKPVEINPSNFRNRREGILKVSFAGPAANLFLCFLAAFFIYNVAGSDCNAVEHAVVMLVGTHRRTTPFNELI